jgi:hypothetical protein
VQIFPSPDFARFKDEKKEFDLFLSRDRLQDGGN